MLDELYRRKEIIENERDETFYIEELKEIKNEIKCYEDEIKNEWLVKICFLIVDIFQWSITHYTLLRKMFAKLKFWLLKCKAFQ